MPGWSWFSSYPVRAPNRIWYGRYWRKALPSGVTFTMPMSCPECLLPWSEEGILMVRGNVDRHWGAPPSGGVNHVYYECAGCGHQAYQRDDE